MRNETEFLTLWNNAYTAGRDAVRDPNYQGPCGFAWINIKPANSAFAKWLINNGKARKDSYNGGVTIWVSDYGQSVDCKYEHASAMSKVFSSNGIRCYASSRLD